MVKKISKIAKPLILSLGLISLLVFFIVSCVQPVYLKMPSTLSAYTFSGYNPPSYAPPASIPLTISVVEPYYKEKISNDYIKVIKSFSRSIGIGLEQILVAKGLTTKGPYGSLDEIPYPDKKNSNLTLTETVFILPIEQEKREYNDYYYDDGYGNPVRCEVRNGKLSVEIWVAYEMREPLSGEKMWIKKLDLGVLERNYQIGIKKYWHSYPQTDPWAPPQGEWRYGDVMFNTKPDAMADILAEIYPKVLNTAWVYLNTEEMLKLNEKAKEIRELKRY